MSIAIANIHHNTANTEKVKILYESFGKKLKAYTCKNYEISEDDAWSLVYKTIYKIASLDDSYAFASDQKKSAFIFKTHINYLRNFFRDDKTFERKNREAGLGAEDLAVSEELPAVPENPALKILQEELDKLEEWERILLLMRGQDMPYSAIVAFVNKPERHLKVYYARLKKQLLLRVNEKLNELKGSDHGKE